MGKERMISLKLSKTAIYVLCAAAVITLCSCGKGPAASGSASGGASGSSAAVSSAANSSAANSSAAISSAASENDLPEYETVNGLEEGIGGGDEEYDGQLAVPAGISLDRITVTQGIFPPVDTARVSSRFGYRQNPVSGKFTFHSGCDLASPNGSNIYAMLSGVVKKASWDDGYGNFIILDHGDVQTLYAHCSKLLVSAGDDVTQGDVIALVGSTGNSTGPHLHVEFRSGGKKYDPEWILGGMYN